MVTSILVVDDEASAVVDHNLEVLANESDYVITISESLDSPLFDTRIPPDIILVDYYFPSNRNGLEYLRRLRNERPDFKGACLMLSVASDMQEKEWKECLALGVIDFISKSTPSEVIKAKIDLLAEKEELRKSAQELMARLSEKLDSSARGQPSLDKIIEILPDGLDYDHIFRIVGRQGPPHVNNNNILILAIYNYLLEHLQNTLGAPLQSYDYELVDGNAIGSVRGSHPPHRKGPGLEYEVPVHHPYHNYSAEPPHERHDHHPPHRRPPDHRGPVSPHQLHGLVPDPHGALFKLPLGIPCRLVRTLYDNNNDKIADAIYSIRTGPPHEQVMNVLTIHIMESLFSAIGK